MYLVVGYQAIKNMFKSLLNNRLRSGYYNINANNILKTQFKVI